MRKEPTSLPGVFLITPDLFPDDRGVVFEAYNKEAFTKLEITDEFLQDTMSVSRKGVLRGLHFQKAPFAQTKLVSVVSGSVFDVAVDLRPGSPTYAKWVGVNLSGDTHQMLYIPKGFAHGFYVLSDEARFTYKISGAFYNKEAATGVIWNDRQIGITWPLTSVTPLLSEQDRLLPPLSSLSQ